MSQGSDDAASSVSGASDGVGTRGSTAADSTATSDETTSGGSGAICGDGLVVDGEVCDDGINDSSYGSCSPDCMSLGPYCGDGVIDGPEVCDDGNDMNGDGCNRDCIASGTVLWTRVLAMDSFSDIAVDEEGGVLLGGQDGALQYYGNDGTPGWSLSTSGKRTRVARHPESLWVIATENGSVGSRDVIVQRFGDDGTMLESFSHASSEDDTVGGVAYDAAGNVYVAGQSEAASDSHAWLRKHTADGGLLWTTAIETVDDDSVAGIAAIDDDGIVIAGTTGPSGDTDIWIRRYDADASLTWMTGYASPGGLGDTALGLACELDGRVAVAGAANGVGFDLDGWFGVFDSDGVFLDDGEIVGDAALIVASDVVFDSSGSIVVVGARDNAPTYPWLRKYDPSGILLWADETEPPDGEGASFACVTVDADDNILAAGEAPLADGSGARVRKYAP